MAEINKAPGYNELRYNCETQGCFNIKKRPKIEIFAECFPRKCNVETGCSWSGNQML